MTGYTVHTGASKKFVSGWDRIFSDDATSKKTGDKKKKAKKALKKAANKKLSKPAKKKKKTFTKK